MELSHHNVEPRHPALSQSCLFEQDAIISRIVAYQLTSVMTHE